MDIKDKNALDMLLPWLDSLPADTRDLNYNSFFVEGDMKVAVSDEYNSNNTRQLNVEEIKKKLGSLKYVRNELAEWRSRR